MTNDCIPSLEQASAVDWDAVVIGAGPAGAVAARELALRECRVLLVDKARFPRDKVCGGCVSHTALKLLESIGLGDLPERLGGRPTRRLLLAAGGRAAAIPVPKGVALSRRSLDAALVQAATLSGVCFLPGTSARILSTSAETCHVRLGSVTVRTAVVVAADGLAGTSLRDCPAIATRVARRSRIGTGVTVTGVEPNIYPAGTIHMACARGGYVGVVRTEDGGLNIAAACDPQFVRSSGGVAPAVRAIVGSAGLPKLDSLNDARWQGTSTLTVRRRPVAHQRVYLIGDTAEYVEPFTGEGMAWAVASAIAVASVAADAVWRWRPELDEDWVKLHESLIHRRSLRCRLVTLALRHGWLTRFAVGLLARAPAIARPLVHEIAMPFQHIASSKSLTESSTH